MLASVLLESEVWRVLRRVLKANCRIEFQDIARCIEVDQCQTVAKHVVNPSDLSRLWSNREPTVKQALVETVAWAKQKLVAPEFDPSAVTIGGAVVDGVDGHYARSGPHLYDPTLAPVPLTAND